jgi:hypothetical protein
MVRTSGTSIADALPGASKVSPFDLVRITRPPFLAEFATGGMRDGKVHASLRVAFGRHGRVAAVLGTLAREVDALLDALCSPNRIIDKVEATGALFREANAIEATNPTRAAQLRARASLILLR